MTATISTLPIWKKDSTPAEWLQELAGLALEFPERWERIVVISVEMDEEMPRRTRDFSYGIESNSEIIGTLEVGKLLVFERLRGRDT